MNDLLKQNNLKVTDIRVIILEELENLNKSVNAEELYKLVIKRKKTNISTIYRNLKVLTNANLILIVTEVNGEIYYRYNDQKHTHHIICVSCNEVLPLDTCPIHDLEDSLKNNTGYEILSHSLEFRGLCPKCKKKTHLD